MQQSAGKQAAAEAALALLRKRLRPGLVVGIGTGSTTNLFIDGLGALRGQLEATVASSEASAERLRRVGLPVLGLNDVARVDLYVDGADESDASLCLIKGGGGALTREKIIAAAAETFVCIADESKLVDRLGGFPLPLEVIPMARRQVARTVAVLGGEAVPREGFVTDNGNAILDVLGLPMEDPVGLESELDHVTGIVCNGLFARRGADLLLLGGASGVRELTPAP